MFFRNLTLFRFQADTAADLARLPDVLAEHRLRPVGPLELSTRGFVPPVGRGEDDPLTHAVGTCTLFTVGGEDKLLPPAVLNEALARKVQHIADEEGRNVGGRERKRIKEDLLTEMLPRAFTCSSRLSGYVDTKHQWLVLDTASRKAAENVLTQVREALGSFPAVPLAPEEGPRVLMTSWINLGPAADFTLGDECELRDPATSTGAIVKCSRQDLDSDEVAEHLRNGKQVFKLGLVFDDRISFVLGEDLVVRKLRFLDVVMDELGDNAESHEEELQATFALMTLELQRLFARLDAIFKLSPDAPLRLHGEPAPSSMRKAVQQLENSARESGGTMTIEHGGKVLATFGDGPDPLIDLAMQFVRRTDKASISGVQRHLKVGYNRAARMVEDMQNAGIISAPDSNGVRTVLLVPSG